MTYRTAAEGPPVTRIRYGPFPRAWRSAAPAPLFPAFLAAFVYLAGGHESLTCERRSCVHFKSYLGIPAGERTFEIDAIDFNPSPSSYSASYVELWDRRGSHWDALVTTDGDGLSEAARHIQSYLAAGTPDRLEASVWNQPVALPFVILAAVTLLGLTIILVTELVRRPGSIDLDLVRSPPSLIVRERWAGLALRSRTFPLDTVTAVTVVHEDGDPWLHSGPRIPAGRLLLVRTDGTKKLVSRTPLWGTTVHDEAAEALRKALALD